LTWLINLLQLAPDIQEEILFLPLTAAGQDSVPEPNGLHKRSRTQARRITVDSWLTASGSRSVASSRSQPFQNRREGSLPASAVAFALLRTVLTPQITGTATLGQTSQPWRIAKRFRMGLGPFQRTCSRAVRISKLRGTDDRLLPAAEAVPLRHGSRRFPRQVTNNMWIKLDGLPSHKTVPEIPASII